MDIRRCARATLGVQHLVNLKLWFVMKSYFVSDVRYVCFIDLGVVRSHKDLDGEG